MDRYGEPPDVFTPAGFAAAVALVEAVKKTGGNTDAEAMIKAIEGMSFETPTGTMTFRPEDHQALQVMYHIVFEKQEGKDYVVPRLVRELPREEIAPPILN